MREVHIKQGLFTKNNRLMKNEYNKINNTMETEITHEKRTNVNNEERAFIHANKSNMTAQQIADHLNLKVNTIRPHLYGKIRMVRKERKPLPPPLHNEEYMPIEDIDLADANGNFDTEKWAKIAY